MGPFSIFADSLSASPPPLIFDPKRCLRTRLNINECQRCLEHCPSKALSVENRTINLDVSRCTGCMSCVAVCPQDALVSDLNLDELLSSFRPGVDVVVSCTHQAQNHHEEITVPCLGIVSKQLLAALLVSGCNSVTFNLIGCTGCRNQSVSEVFLVACNEVRQELSDMNVAKVVLLTKEKHLPPPEINRRSYLAKIRDIAVGATKQRFLSQGVTPVAEPEGRRRVPFKTQLVKKMLTSLDEVSQKKILGLFAHNVSINENCNCCPLCKGICPTGAIKINRSTQGKRFQFEMLDCSGCGLCVEFCKKQALALNQARLHSPDRL